ncbi:hypothetical protein HYC85_023815 [Camellia sinensis]|uniref:DNA-directed RNA polymerase subunit n=1 Tax=Camellia sinensis TaxID=4442 RepID=A0A7J7GJF9_CAMSI|nr:hypothetical protein HYC85_023815 [Camellia sinensis]
MDDCMSSEEDDCYFYRDSLDGIENEESDVQWAPTKGLSTIFFHIVLERNKQLHPPPLRSRPPREADLQAHERRGGHLQVLFYSKFTNNDKTCGRHGFVVVITGIENVGKGLIRDGTGFVTFPVKYQCVVFRPFKGEILEAVVTMVNKVAPRVLDKVGVDQETAAFDSGVHYASILLMRL